MYVKLTMFPFFIIICTLSGTTMSTNMKMKLKIGIDIETRMFEYSKTKGTEWNEEMKLKIGIDIETLNSKIRK